MRTPLILAAITLLTLAGCGGPLPNYCTGPHQLEGYVLQPDGSKTTCLATRTGGTGAQGGR